MANPLLRPARSLEAMLAEVAADIVQPRPEQTEGATARAENSLYDFARQAWPVLEPARGFVDGWHIGCIAEHLQAVEALEIRNLIINIPPRHGKPVEESELVLMGDGTRKPLARVEVGDQVVTHEARARQVLAVHVQGELECVRVRTHHGREIIAAPDHPFLTPRGWVSAGDLRPGDTLAVLDLYGAVVGTEDGSPLEAFRLAGYFIGDGNTSPASDPTGTQASITCLDDEELADIRHCCAALGFDIIHIGHTRGQYGVSGGVREWLRGNGMDRKTAWEKRVPAFVFQAGPAGIANFLGAYFACDGTVNRKGGKRKDLCISFASVNRLLLEDVRHLLTRVGVVGRVRKRVHMNNPWVEPGYVFWVLDVTGEDNVARFVDRVPVYGVKAARLLAWRPVRKAFDTRYIADEVVALEPAGLRPCRCLTVEEDATFTAGDVVVHNSILAGVCFFCWTWIRQPSSQWIYCSYGERLAERDSNKCRDLIQSAWYQARWGHIFRLKRAQNAAERFANDRQGYRIATTIAGKAMGEGADFLLFDDPHKPTEVRSEAHRLQVLESWQKTMSTRGNDPKTVCKLLIMQRLHERDLTGYLVAERGGYEHLVLPAEYEPRRYWFLGARGDDGNGARGEFRKDAEKKPRNAIVPTVLQRRRPELVDGPTGSGRTEEGDLLWPAQFGPAEIATLKGDLEGPGWAGQGQQRPAPEEGSLFKQDFFRRFTLHTGQSGLEVCLYQGEDKDPLLLPAWRLRFFQVADTALSAKSTSSYTVCVTFAFDRLTRYLLVWDVFRQRLMVHEQLPALLELRQGKGLWDVGRRAWALPGALLAWPNPVAFQAVEAKASGQGLIDEALSLGKPIRGLNPGSQDKVQRAALAVTLYGQGKVWHRAEAPWLTDLEDELLSFPTGAQDDQVDCISYGCRLASEDGILNADIDGPLMMPEPRNPDGSPMTVEDLRASEANLDIVRVGNYEVEFPEDEDPWGK